jgi:hypothetical protein
LRAAARPSEGQHQEDRPAEHGRQAEPTDRDQAGLVLDLERDGRAVVSPVVRRRFGGRRGGPGTGGERIRLDRVHPGGQRREHVDGPEPELGIPAGHPLVAGGPDQAVDDVRRVGVRIARPDQRHHTGDHGRRGAGPVPDGITVR